MEINGKIHKIFDTVEVSDKFKKREFVLIEENEYNGKIYYNYPKFQMTQDKVTILDMFKIGDVVDVKFNLRGNEYTKDGKTSYFVSLDAWRVDKAGDEMPNMGATDDLATDSMPDDLPF